MPDSVYKNDEIRDDEVSLSISQLGPEEKFAGSVLKSLKEKIEDAREELESIKEEQEQTLQETEEEKEQILNEAQQEADQIIEEAEQEAEEIISARQEEVDEARQEGYDDGYEDAVEDAQEETATLIEQGEHILEEARRERNAFIGQREKEVMELVSSLASRVVREYVDLNPEVVQHVVEDAIDQVREVREITVVLHPEDYEIIQDVVTNFREEHPSLQEIMLVEDHKMSRGGCRIHTDFGDIEGTIDGQIEHLTEQLIAQDVIEKFSKNDLDKSKSDGEMTQESEPEDDDPTSGQATNDDSDDTSSSNSEDD